jgi:hypothetical protein
MSIDEVRGLLAEMLEDRDEGRLSPCGPLAPPIASLDGAKYS